MSASALVRNRRPDIVDQFGRTVASGWGTADSGQAWSVSSTAMTSVGSGVGVFTPSAANQTVGAQLAAPSADLELSATCSILETPSGATIGAYLVARNDSATSIGGNRYEVLALFNIDGTVLTRLRAVVSSSPTNLLTLQNNVAYTPGTPLNLRLRIVGSTLQAKAWFVGDAEPGWSSATNTSLTEARWCGLGEFVSPGNTSTNRSVSWDNFSCRALYPNVRDSFSRTVGAGGWGAADSGHGWVVTAGATTDFSVSGGRGRISHSAANTFRLSTLTLPTMDADLVCDMGVAEVAVGGAQSIRVGLRADSAMNTGYRVASSFATNGNVTFTLQRLVSSSATALATDFASFSYTAGEMFRVRFQCIGATIQAKVWRAADPEPSPWTASVVDTSPVNSGTHVLFQTNRASGNTNPDPTLLVDNFFVRPLRPAINDAFDRTVASGWGNLTSGQAWTNSDTAVMSVGSGKGVMTPAANTSVAGALAAPGADVEVRAVVDIAQTPTGGVAEAAIQGRAGQSGTSGDRYDVVATFSTAGNVTVILRRAQGGATTLATLIASSPYTPGTGLNLQLRCVGSKLMGRAWLVGQSEPAWSEVSDTAIVAAGFVKCLAFRASGSTTPNPNVLFDDFQVIDLSRPLRLDTGSTGFDPSRLVAV